MTLQTTHMGIPVDAAENSRDLYVYKADFLWPVIPDSVEEAGYEFANAQTEAYRQHWWLILLARAKDRS